MTPSQKAAETPSDIIIEIGAEELPALYIEPAAEEFARMVSELLDAKNVRHGDFSYTHTPRRLTVIVPEVAAKATDKTEEFIGPAVGAGRSNDGSFKIPALGFARKLGIPPEKLIIKKLPKGEYFAAEINIPGGKTEKIINDAMPGIIARIKFPKSMVWNDTKFRFARPIRNILAIYGKKVLKFEVAAIKSSNKTFGAGPGFGKKIVITTASKYFQTLKNTCVLADHKEREKLLRRALEAAAGSVKARAIFDEDLAREVNSLVEYPTALVGRFDKKYLALPEEILVTCMKKKQKFFALRTAKDGSLTENFIAVKNGISAGVDRIVAGYEKVLAARLEDALFFYNNDLKLGQSPMASKLDGITFREGLGSIAGKTARVKELAVSFAGVLGLDGDAVKNIARGAELSKADLSSEIIFEYPELSGIAGAIYAKNAGENDKVCSIIREHYYPALAGDGALPSTTEAAVVAIADKADTIASDFYLGIIPTGSEDPYGLRRVAAGLLRILLDKKIGLAVYGENVRGIFSEAVDKIVPAGEKRANVRAEILVKIQDFLRQRLETIFQERGFAADEIRAALAAGFDDIPDTAARIEALSVAKRESAFEQIIIPVKRAANILRVARGEDNKAAKTPEAVNYGAATDEALFVEIEEKELSAAVDSLIEKFNYFKKSKDYLGALNLLSGLAAPLENFFNKVKVMAPEENLRRNRLALLNRIVERYRAIADFSELKIG
ncbi:MAG: glycine--tRNA ligase subunit beta [Endomicrobiia bacterium]|nr:glycine--tRNA ligase subunit beta [Endomicrobiia bacterium]